MYLAKSRRPSLLEHNNRYILLTTFRVQVSRLLMTSFATNIKSSILFRPGSPQGIGLSGIARGVFQLLQRAIADKSEMILYIEDDVRFNRYLRHNLKRWPPLAGVGAHNMFFGSLFNPNIPAIERHQNEAYFLADTRYIFGSQALIFSLAGACHLTEYLLCRFARQELFASEIHRTVGGSIRCGLCVGDRFF